MHPIKEYDFTVINKSLALEFIDIHNSICNDVLEINKRISRVSSKKYLDVFISNFSCLDDKNERLVEQTIICAPKKKLNQIFDNCSKVKDQNIELIPCIQLTSIDYYKNLQKKANELSANSAPTPAQDKKLKKIQAELNGSIKLKPLLQKVFDYTGRRKNLLQYYNIINYKVCVYCLAQYTSIYRSTASGQFYLTGNLDHVKAKSTNPFLSLSINNLVPVCAHCNQRKSDRNFKYDPFNLKHIHNFDFSDCIDIVNSNVILKPLNKLKISPRLGAFTDLANKLDFKDLYCNHATNAQLLVDRYQKYNSDGYNEHLNSITNKSNSREFIEYFISEVPLNDDNILKHPLTKFKIDLFNALKLKSSKP